MKGISCLLGTHIGFEFKFYKLTTSWIFRYNTRVSHTIKKRIEICFSHYSQCRINTISHTTNVFEMEERNVICFHPSRMGLYTLLMKSVLSRLSKSYNSGTYDSARTLKFDEYLMYFLAVAPARYLNYFSSILQIFPLYPPLPWCLLSWNVDTLMYTCKRYVRPNMVIKLALV